MQWLNTAGPIALENLRGHVVVLDFWTYCCINCIHTLPDLAQLETEFSQKPVVVIGVHSAKFDNENQPEHVQSAIDRYQINHPVVIDSEHQIWEHYAVRAWPTLVVIDSEGYIRWHGSGEGHLDEIRHIVKQLLLDARRTKTLANQPLALTQKASNKQSTLNFPGKICFDARGERLFISDSNHHRILETELTSPTTLKITATIGQSEPGLRDGTTRTSQFNQPQGLTFSNGYLYIADTGNHAIRQAWVGESVASKGGQTPTVTTIAGTGTKAGWGAHGGNATQVALSSPWDVVYFDHALWIAMAGTHQIWRLDFGTNHIEPWAGSGAENLVDGPLSKAQFAQPSGLAYNGTHLFVADSETSSLRAVQPIEGQVHTLIGQGLFIFGHQNGPWDSALFQHPLGITATDTELFVADTYNHAIRQVDLRQERVSTLIKAIDHQTCQIGDESCAVLPLYEPNDLKLRGNHLYIADTNNHLIRMYDLKTRQLHVVQIDAS